MTNAASLSVVDRCLRLHAATQPYKIAITDANREQTYAQLNDRVDHLAATFVSLGLAKGEHVAILMRNRIEWAELMFGMARSGIVAVPLNNRLSPAEIGYQLQHAGCVAIIAEADLVHLLDGQLETIPAANRLVIGANSIEGFVLLEDCIVGKEPAQAVPVPVSVNDRDTWYLTYTSGTTGLPKGIPVDHRSRQLGALYAAREYDINERDATWLVMPLYHSNGIFFLFMFLFVGGTCHIADKFDPMQALDQIEKHRVSLVSMVPTMYAMMLALPYEAWHNRDLSALRVTISSSAPLSDKTREGMLSRFPGASVFEFYGSSEASFVTSLRPEDQGRAEPSVGRAFPGVEIRILDEDGNEAGPGEVGELWSRSPFQVFDGYYLNDHATRAAWKEDGFFSAGDMARRDAEGFISIVDRKKDLIISGGENIYPTEVEQVLGRHPAIREVAIVGVPDEIWGDRVCAVVILEPGSKLSLPELRDWCRGRIAEFKRPRELVTEEELPKGPTGKLLRRVLRDRLHGRDQAKNS